jgi:hypothetical protein
MFLEIWIQMVMVRYHIISLDKACLVKFMLYFRK